MKYNIVITFRDGDRAEIRCEAENQAEALSKIENSPQVIDFSKGKVVENINIDIDTTKEIECDYVLQPSADCGWWVVTDKTNLCVVKFKANHYNETAKVSFINDTSNIKTVDLATIIRKIGEWVFLNHKELI